MKVDANTPSTAITFKKQPPAKNGLNAKKIEPDADQPFLSTKAKNIIALVLVIIGIAAVVFGLGMFVAIGVATLAATMGLAGALVTSTIVAGAGATGIYFGFKFFDEAWQELVIKKQSELREAERKAWREKPLPPTSPQFIADFQRFYERRRKFVEAELD